MSFREQFRDKRVLVTGGTGFLGGRLVERLHLELGARVRVLLRNYGRAMRIARFSEIEWSQADMLDRERVAAAAADVDVILHCAHDMGGSFPKKSLRDNVEATANVIHAARTHGARLVHVSSLAVYGFPAVDRLDETFPRVVQKNLYAEGKRRTEEHVVENYRKSPFPVSIVQPTIIYGPFAGWTIGTCSNVRAGSYGLVDEGRGCCNPVHVDDVVDSMLLAATRDGAIGERFLVSGPDSVSWKEWYEAHREILGAAELVSLTTGALDARERAKRRSRSLGQVARSAGSVVLGAATSQAMRVGFVESAFKGSMRVVGDALFHVPGCAEWDQSVRAWLRKRRAQAAIASAGGTAESDVRLPPDDWTRKMFEHRASVDIGKARQKIGYDPRYDFAAGMADTAAFIRWARF